MANPEHVEMLDKGVEDWNRWREENPSAIPDLKNANLTGADLRYYELGDVNMKGAKLDNANLTNCNLYDANFEESHMWMAELSYTDLSGVKMKSANLFRANLNGANLQYAELVETYLDEANLAETNLVGANLCKADLRGANLSSAKLHSANLTSANFFRANLILSEFNDANLFMADLTESELSGSDFHKANLRETILCKANLSGAYLRGADLRTADISNVSLKNANLIGADLRGVKLNGVNLERATLVGTNLEGADISGCRIYGISAWNCRTNQETKQDNLTITPENEPIVLVDNLEVAQFVYLLLNNSKIRNVIDTIGKKGVLILGRFTPERKAVLDAIRNKLRVMGFVPMMFDFEKSSQRDFTETIKTLAGMSRFIIADITNPKSAPLELQATMPDYMIPFVPIIHENEEPFAMFRDLKQKYGEWVLDLLEYDSAEGLVDVLDEAIVQPALDKAYELIDQKAEDIKKRHVKDFKKKPNSN